MWGFHAQNLNFVYSLTLKEEKLFSEKLTRKFVSNWGLGVWTESKLPRLSRGGLVAAPLPSESLSKALRRQSRRCWWRGGQTAAAAALCLGSAEAKPWLRSLTKELSSLPLQHKHENQMLIKWSEKVYFQSTLKKFSPCFTERNLSVKVILNFRATTFKDASENCGMQFEKQFLAHVTTERTEKMEGTFWWFSVVEDEDFSLPTY